MRAPTWLIAVTGLWIIAVLMAVVAVVSDASRDRRTTTTTAAAPAPDPCFAGNVREAECLRSIKRNIARLHRSIDAMSATIASGYARNTPITRPVRPYRRPVRPYRASRSRSRRSPESPKQAPEAPSPPEGDGAALGAFEATCYALRGTTASGAPAGPGSIAVDPRVIPLGTRLRVEGYGRGVARDTGGAIKGRRVDVWLPTTAACMAWGRRTVDVWREP